MRSFSRRCFLPGFSAFSTMSSPKRLPRYDQNAWPYRYGERSRAAAPTPSGKRSLSTASRSHNDESGSSEPRDRYSAIPSMNHNGCPVSPP